MNPVILADSRFLDGTPTATDTAAGYDVLNIRDNKPFTSWKAASAGTKYLAVDCGSAKSADAIGIYKHNLGTAEASVSVESSATGAWAGEQVQRLAPFTPANDKAVLKTFAASSARYWRVKIVTASVAAQIAECSIGARLEFPYPPDSQFVPVSESIEAQAVQSKSGQRLEAIVRFVNWTVTPVWSGLSRTWLDANVRPFWSSWARYLYPFYWAWDLNEYPNEILWGAVPEEYVYDPSVSILSRYDRFRLEITGTAEL